MERQIEFTGPYLVEGQKNYVSLFFGYEPTSERTACSLLLGHGTGENRQEPKLSVEAEVSRYYKDEPNGYLGRKQALTKALAKTSLLNKHDRTKIWKRFNEVEALNIAMLGVDKEVKRCLAQDSKDNASFENREELLEFASLQLVEVARQLIGELARRVEGIDELEQLVDSSINLDDIEDKICA